MSGVTPAYFKKAGLERFKELKLEDDDVVMVSFPKCGTSWMHQILFCLLRMDDGGEFPAPLEQMVASWAQVYPDSLPSGAQGTRPALTVDALETQRRPRLFSCHIRAGNLPPSLLKHGRLVMISRNPKDALVSGFYFMKKIAAAFPDNQRVRETAALPLEDFYGNFNASVPEPGDGYGDYYSWHRDMADLLDRMGVQRSIFTLYESLQADFRGEVSRLASFLGLGTLSDAKLSAIASRVSLEAMGERKVFTVRKGVVGDHMSHLTPTHWAEMDKLFWARLEGVQTLRPLHQYMGPSASAGRPRL